MPDGITYLLRDINRKLLLVAEFDLPKKADRLMDALFADMIQLEGQIKKYADSTTNAQAENAEAKGQ